MYSMRFEVASRRIFLIIIVSCDGCKLTICIHEINVIPVLLGNQRTVSYLVRRRLEKLLGRLVFVGLKELHMHIATEHIGEYQSGLERRMPKY